MEKLFFPKKKEARNIVTTRVLGFKEPRPRIAPVRIRNVSGRVGIVSGDYNYYMNHS